MTLDGTTVTEWRDKVLGSTAKMTRQAGTPTLVPVGISGDATTIRFGLPGLSTGRTYRTFRHSGTVPAPPQSLPPRHDQRDTIRNKEKKIDNHEWHESTRMGSIPSHRGTAATVFVSIRGSRISKYPETRGITNDECRRPFPRSQRPPDPPTSEAPTSASSSSIQNSKL
jgi:hypothetical protein